MSKDKEFKAKKQRLEFFKASKGRYSSRTAKPT